MKMNCKLQSTKTQEWLLDCSVKCNVLVNSETVGDKRYVLNLPKVKMVQIQV